MRIKARGGRMGRLPLGPTRLGEVLRLYRTVNNRALREQAPEMGLIAATLMRIEAGQAIDAVTMLKLWTWLMSRPERAQ